MPSCMGRTRPPRAPEDLLTIPDACWNGMRDFVPLHVESARHHDPLGHREVRQGVHAESHTVRALKAGHRHFALPTSSLTALPLRFFTRVSPSDALILRGESQPAGDRLSSAFQGRSLHTVQGASLCLAERTALCQNTLFPWPCIF